MSIQTHVVIILEKGNCVKNKVTEIQSNADALHEMYENNPNPPVEVEKALGHAGALLTAYCEGTEVTRGTLDSCIEETANLL